MVPFWLVRAILRIHLVKQEKFRSLVSSVSALSHPAHCTNCFEIYPRFGSIRYGDRTDRETVALKEEFMITVPKRGGLPIMRATRGSSRVSQEAGERGESVDQTLYY